MNIGMNFHSPTLDNPEGLRRLALRWGLFLVDPDETWNSTIHRWPQVKELCPRCQPVVRFYRPDVMGKSPAFRAGQFCVLLNDEFGDEPVHSIPFNEADQAIEHGGHDLGGEPFGAVPWSSPEGLAAIARWASGYADAHRALRPQDILHLPACSAEMPAAAWYAAMRAGGAMQKYNVLDVHLYASWQLSRLWDTQAIGNTFISEVGVRNGTIEAITYLIQSLGDADFAWWKWNDKDDNPEGDPAGYAIADRPDVIEALAESKEEDKVPEDIEEVMDPLYHTWIEEYRVAHNGMYPDDWEFHKHRLAIDANLPVTQAHVNAVEEDLRAAIKQLEMLKARLGGGSAPAPFQPVVIYEWTDNHGGTREKTDLIIIHSSRSGKKRTAEQELASTRSWFANPKAQASAQAAIAANGDIYLFVPAEQVSWGATYLNERAINIELVQARIEIPFTDEQYTSLAWLLKEWTGLFGVPYVRIMDENERGIIGHEDSAQGQSYGKSDPGYMLDWSRIGL